MSKFWFGLIGKERCRRLCQSVSDRRSAAVLVYQRKTPGLNRTESLGSYSLAQPAQEKRKHADKEQVWEE